ncbi:MAG: excinuclease ABC subunit C, partial [Chlorobiaceae bacterium]|nr:excinuclease ABC subunit C [Chlorobiaceae bacterium]
EEAESLRELLTSRQHGQRQVRFTVPRIGEKARLIDMCLDNAEHHLHEFMVQKKLRGEISRKSPALESLQQVLHLEKLPERIECFDNSHFQGTDYVSSMVTFVSGKPKKSDYRKFKLKSFEGSDDYAAMREALTRRYGGSLAGELPMPDLVLIDGGKGQVNVAWQALRELGLDLPVAGLAKRLEEIFVPNERDPYNLPKTSPALKLLQQLRDEAHRFAITYHRKLRTDRTIRTELTGIRGIGEKSAEKLLSRFGSVETIAKASVEELSEVTGRKTAESIYRYFREQGAGEP